MGVCQRGRGERTFPEEGCMVIFDRAVDGLSVEIQLFLGMGLEQSKAVQPFFYRMQSRD